MNQDLKPADISRAPIGVFDSGVGGLTVAREIMRQIPNESICYFGDDKISIRKSAKKATFSLLRKIECSRPYVQKEVYLNGKHQSIL